MLETATDPLLGDNAFILRPITALRWDFNASVTLGINVEYNFTPMDDEANDVSALEVKFPVAFKINDDWSGFVSYNPRWNLLDESDRHRLELGTTCVWGSDNQYAWSLGTEVPLTSESFEFKLDHRLQLVFLTTMTGVAISLRFPVIAAVVALGMFSGRLAADAPGNGEFSKPPEIEKRLETVRAELRDLPAGAAPEINDKLRKLEATCQYHLEAVDFLAAARNELAKARQESSAWCGFQEPPPYSVLLLDEIRASIATLENSERTGAAQLRIFKAELEALQAKLSGHQQAERRLRDEIGQTTDPEALQDRPTIIEVGKPVRTHHRGENRPTPASHRHRGVQSCGVCRKKGTGQPQTQSRSRQHLLCPQGPGRHSGENRPRA